MNDTKGLILYFITFIIFISLGFLIVYKVLVPLVDRLGDYIVTKLLKSKIKSWSIFLIVLDIINTFIIFSLLILCLAFYKKPIIFIILLIVYVVLLLTLTRVFFEIKKLKNNNYVPFIRKTLLKFNKDKYIISRLNIIINSIPSIMVHFIVIYLLLVGIISFPNIDLSHQYFLLLVLPISAVTYIFIGTKNDNEKRVRRIIVYFGIVIVIIRQYFIEYSSIPSNDTNLEIFFIAFFIAAFIAMHSFINEIIVDYKTFKN